MKVNRHPAAATVFLTGCSARQPPGPHATIRVHIWMKLVIDFTVDAVLKPQAGGLHTHHPVVVVVLPYIPYLKS
jgi:hypothetical protein